VVNIFNFSKRKSNEEIRPDDAEFQNKSNQEPERYIGPCDKCGFMNWETISFGMVHYVCSHQQGYGEHIIGYNGHADGDFYELPSGCPLRTKGK